jgi:hypothetical protein
MFRGNHFQYLLQAHSDFLNTLYNATYTCVVKPCDNVTVKNALVNSKYYVMKHIICKPSKSGLFIQNLSTFYLLLKLLYFAYQRKTKEMFPV